MIQTQVENKKKYVVDTNVLLYDKEAIHAFVGNKVYLTMQVLDELDKFKSEPGIIGENARYVNRYLDSLRGPGKSLATGIFDSKHNIEYFVVLNQASNVDTSNIDLLLDMSVPDNRILLDVTRMMRVHPEGQIVVVTKDINLRVKCDSLGIHAEDYYKDSLQLKSLQDEDCIWSGQTTLEITHESINQFHSEGRIDVPSSEQLSPNSLVVLKYENQSGIGVVDQDTKSIKKLVLEQGGKSAVKPYDKEQTYTIHMLQRHDIPLLTITGAPGSGKTFLTLLVGMEELNANRYERIVFTRSIQPVGKEMGFLPGDIDEKMEPWLGPIMDNFRHAYKDMTYFKMLMSKGKIDIAPLSFIRGRSFPKSYIIVDEAQNATIHELKTVITRAGEGSKIILMGDIDQIDTPYIDRLSNGLSVVIDRFKDSPLAGHIHLNKGRRSALANEANKLL
jgi:PhoH-like ATPase